MQDKKVDRPGVAPGSRTVEDEISNPKDQESAKSEVPPSLPASTPGRLPARASQS